MGFKKDESIKALVKFEGNLNKALNYLLKQNEK
jgi:hypothetical protein